MEYLDLILKVIGGVTVVSGALFALLKLHQWLKPIKISPIIHFPSEKAGRGVIGAKIVNQSREAQYILNCEAKGTYGFLNIAAKHLRKPFVHPRLYPTMRFNTIHFSMIGDNPPKIDPYEPTSLEHYMGDNPLAYFYTPYFIIEVELSTGKKVRSRKVEVPFFWHHPKTGLGSNQWGHRH